MTLTYDSFLRASSTNDKNIIIQDPNGKVIHTINPYSVINTFVSNNLLKISLSSDRVITLNFVQANLAKQALNILQERITSLKVDTPLFIDKQVENYVEDYVDTKISQNKITQIINLTNGSGSLNYVPRWISSTALSFTGSIFDTGSNVTIGKTSSSNTSLVNIRGYRDTFTGPIFDPRIDSYFKQSWFLGGYGLTSSALFVQGTIDGLGVTFSSVTNSYGNSGGYIAVSSDRKPLVRFSATGWGTTLLVENNSPVGGGTIPYQGQQTIPTYFRGPDPLFIWEDTQFQRSLILERTSLQFEWRVAVGNPQYAQYRHITLQRNGFSHEFIISATVNAGTTFLPTFFAEGTVNAAAGQQVYSGSPVVISPSTDQITPSNQVTFNNLSNRNGVVSGMILSSSGNNEINRRFEQSQNKWVNLFPVSTVLVQSVVGNTVILSATPSYALKTTDKLWFSGQIASDSVGVGRSRILITNGVPTEYPEGGPAPAGTVYSLKITKPIVRTLYPGDTFLVAYSAGNVGIGTGASTNYKLNVSGGSVFDNSIILQGPKVTTPFLKMTYGVPLQSNFNIMVGDQFGDARWVPSGQIVGSGFTGTSSTSLTIGNVGSYFQISTQPFLSFRPGQVVVLYDELQALYSDPNYQNGFGFKKIIAEIDGYNFNSGTMSLVTLYSQSIGSQSDSWSIQLSGAVGPQGQRGFGDGTATVSGSIIPDRDYTDVLGGYDLGSPTNRWENIYVKDALVASQSLYLGNIKLSEEGNVLQVGDTAVNKYEGSSNTDLTIGENGQVISLITEKNLSYVQGDTVKVSNRLKDNYQEVGYSEEGVYGYFIGLVDTYYRETGEIKIVITYTESQGFQSNVWYLKLNSDMLGFEDDLSNNLKYLKVIGTSSTTMVIPQIDDVREFYTQLNLGFYTGQEVIVFNEFFNNYEDPEYQEGDSNYFIGKVDFYYPNTGLLTVVTDYTVGSGTFSSWQITLTSLPQSNSQLGTTASFEELTVTGPSNIQQVIEVLTTATATGLSPSTYELNFDDGSIFYLEPEGDNFVANYLNVPTTDNRIISTTIVISQTASAYIPNLVAINGDIIPISWANGSLPSGNANQTDIVGFSFMRIGATWSKVFGQLSTFATI